VAAGCPSGDSPIAATHRQPRSPPRPEPVELPHFRRRAYIRTPSRRSNPLARPSAAAANRGLDRHERALIRAEDCTKYVLCIPDECRKCGRELSGTRATFKRRMTPIRTEFDTPLLQRADVRRLPRTVGTPRTHPDVPGGGRRGTDQQRAERALRHAVIWRKLSFGTQSASGSRFVERMLTVVGTGRRQGHNVFEWLTEAVRAHFTGATGPSLLHEA
jgi:hypothetical protein